MTAPSEAIATYIAAKDGNRPWLMRQAFAEGAQLEISVRTDAISFPATTTGVDAITDVVVRRFACDYENVYTFCLCEPPGADVRRFECDWLVGMSERATGDVRVGCGRYEWSFATSGAGRVERLGITIERMQVLSREHSAEVMHWLSALPYPWCPSEQALGKIPPLDDLRAIADDVHRRD